MPPLGPLESYQPNITAGENQLFDLEVLKFGIAMNMGGLVYAAEISEREAKESGRKWFKALASIHLESKTPTVYYPTAELADENYMAAWITRSPDNKFCDTLYTQVTQKVGEVYVPTEDPVARVTSDTHNGRPLDIHGVDVEFLPFAEHKKLIDDINDVIQLISTATYPPQSAEQ